MECQIFTQQYICYVSSTFILLSTTCITTREYSARYIYSYINWAITFNDSIF